MQWHSASEFFAMGGYALYVWGSVGACALAIAVEWWLLRRRHRRLVDALRRRPAPAPDSTAARPSSGRPRESTA